MDRSQYDSRRSWHIIPEGEDVTVLWWKVTGGTGKLFIEFLVDEPKRDRAQQEKDFKESLKGYGEIMKRQVMTQEEIEKKRKQ